MRTARLSAFVLSAGLLVAGVTLAPVARVHAAPPAQATIAMVNIESVFNALDERSVMESDLKASVGKYEEELKTLSKQIEDEENKGKMLPEGPDRDAASQKIAEMRVNLTVKQEFYKALIDQRRSKLFQNLYTKISAAAKRLAESGKYSMVISSDESTTLPPNASSQDVQRFISLKRFVYVNPAHDVTEELVTLMNNEYKSAGKK